MEFKTLNVIIQIAGAIGSLATFGAFIFLFRRDKDKQTQIDKLSEIATVLDAQNDTMKLQNDLMAQQVDIFRNTSILKDSDSASMLALKEIEEKRLRLSVKPNLWLNGAGYHGFEGKLNIDLNNKGEDARLIEFKLTSEDIILQNISLPYDLGKGQRTNICGRTNGNKHIKDCNYEIDIIYADKLENSYVTKVIGKGADVKIIETKSID